MLSNKSVLKEEAYIGEELLVQESDLERRCLVARQTVQDGDFPLEEALALYNISQNDYEKFIAANIVQEIQGSLAGETAGPKPAVVMGVLAKAFGVMFGGGNTKSSSIVKQLETLSKELKDTKISA